MELLAKAIFGSALRGTRFYDAAFWCAFLGSAFRRTDWGTVCARLRFGDDWAFDDAGKELEVLASTSRKIVSESNRRGSSHEWTVSFCMESPNFANLVQ